MSPRARLILREGALIGWLVVCVYLLLALSTYSISDPGWSHTGDGSEIHNVSGITGSWLADIFFSLFGYIAYLFPVLLAVRAWKVFRSHKEDESSFDGVVFALRILGLILVMVSATALASLHYSHLPTAMPMGWGGILGDTVGAAAEGAFSYIGSTLILVAIFLFGLTIFTDISWLALIDKLGRWAITASDIIRSRFEARKARREDREKAEEAQQRRIEVIEKQARKELTRKPPSIQLQQKPAAPSKRAEKEKQTSLFEEPVKGSLPPISLLDRADPPSDKGFSKESLEAMSKLLELKLQDFGVTAEVVEVLPGPVITRFEIQPAAGVKVSRITNLAKDLARSLAVVSVRVVEVIPGKSVVGIEIPNEHREIVRLSEVLSSEVYDHAKSPLTLALGHDISGVPMVADLARMPHLLVAGTTGSGKSVGINAMLLSLLYKAGPEDVRLILVDPKMLELSVYDDIPHLLTPVITDMKDAANGLRWCVGEMERRYKLMAALGVRNLSGYNRKVADAEAAGTPIVDPLWQPDPGASLFDDENGQQAPELNKLPYIVVVIDEFADMMMIVGKKVEQLIARIAQKARAAGIHLILATQRPSVDVITGLIKANVPSRIAFQVSSKVDSRTILDQGGADQLLGHGDMLYLPPGTGVPVRVHGAFVDDHEVHKVVADWKRRGAPEYLDEILDQSITAEIAVPGFAAEGSGDSDDESDPLYDEAVALVIDSRKASISSVQRKLRIGYNRAARLIEQMEASGVVSEMSSNGNREVLVPSHKD
ncbi:MAG: DNA translocase FtsK 4TM domain-containing protein [Pseudomonadales bacterium]|nr:DNA translocase FtsK 4TM domain-containing protein [Pseudomonadales bacterium]MCP5171639.1 DNA translocase FtsK 4TM domain-containing protein [Pseudomonadales bacterium]